MPTVHLSPSRRRSHQLRSKPPRAQVVITLLIASVVVVGLWADGRLDSTFESDGLGTADVSSATDLTGAMAIQAQGLNGDSVRIAFVPHWFASSKDAAYQYRLEGVDPEWRAITDHGA